MDSQRYTDFRRPLPLAAILFGSYPVGNVKMTRIILYAIRGPLRQKILAYWNRGDYS